MRTVKKFALNAVFPLVYFGGYAPILGNLFILLERKILQALDELEEA
jgi:hypothetical protein